MKIMNPDYEEIGVTPFDFTDNIIRCKDRIKMIQRMFSEHHIDTANPVIHVNVVAK